jgi:hypothetical protein
MNTCEGFGQWDRAIERTACGLFILKEGITPCTVPDGLKKALMHLRASPGCTFHDGGEDAFQSGLLHPLIPR